MDIAQFITITRGTLSGRVLLVDDMVDTGMTFNKVFDHLKNQFAEITELRSAVLWWKGHSQATPDYYVDKLPTNPGFTSRSRTHDSLRPHQLKPGSARAPRAEPPDREVAGRGRAPIVPGLWSKSAARARIAGYR